MAIDETKVLTLDNIFAKAQDAASIGDGDYLYFQKNGNGASVFSRIEASRALQGGGGQGSGESGGSGVTFSINGNIITMHINPSANEPSVSMSANSLNFGDVVNGSSKTLPILITSKNLVDDITISVGGSAFGLSASMNGTFSQSITIQRPSSGGSTSGFVYLRFSPTSTMSYSATVTAVSGLVTRTLSFVGEGVAQVVPTITLSSPTNAITFDAVGTAVTQSFTVSGRNLEGAISLAASASGNGSVSLSESTVSTAEAENGKVVTLTYTPADVDGDTITVTATSENAATKTLQLTASNVSRLDAGATFDYGQYTFTVLNDRSTVSVKFKQLGTGQLTIPATAYDGNNVPYRVIEVAESGFEGKAGITSVTFKDNGVEIIRNRGFAACTGITSVKFPNTLTHIGVSGNTYAFSSSKITSLTIPSSVKFIGQQAFYNSTSLETITINGMVSSSNGGVIGNNAFVGCTGLKTVISKISLSGVSSWSSVLPSIGGTGTFPKISGVNAFGFGSSDSPTYIKLLVPDSDSVTAYANAGYWGCFKDIRLEE